MSKMARYPAVRNQISGISLIMVLLWTTVCCIVSPSTPVLTSRLLQQMLISNLISTDLVHCSVTCAFKCIHITVHLHFILFVVFNYLCLVVWLKLVKCAAHFAVFICSSSKFIFSFFINYHGPVSNKLVLYNVLLLA